MAFALNNFGRKYRLNFNIGALCSNLNIEYFCHIPDYSNIVIVFMFVVFEICML